MRKAEEEEGNHSILLERKGGRVMEWPETGMRRGTPKARGLTLILIWVAYFDKGTDLVYELPSHLQGF